MLLLAVVGALGVQQLGVEVESLVVQDVAHALGLGAQVVGVVLVGRLLDRDLGGDGQPVALEPADLLGVVGEDADRGEAEVGEDLGADPVVAQVGGQPETLVGFDGVEAVLLQAVGLELVQQADPAPLLGEVEQDPLSLALDHRKGGGELLAAVAAQRVEDVAGEALGVHAHEHVGLPGDVALDERDVVLLVDERAVADGLELPEGRRQAGGDDAFDEPVVAPPVGDQVGDRDHLQPVARCSTRRGRARAPSSRPRS